MTGAVRVHGYPVSTWTRTACMTCILDEAFPRTSLQPDAGAARTRMRTDEPFLAGDALTLADLYLAPQLANCAEKAPQLLDGLEGFRAWAGRMAERESFRRT